MLVGCLHLPTVSLGPDLRFTVSECTFTCTLFPTALV